MNFRLSAAVSLGCLAFVGSASAPLQASTTGVWMSTAIPDGRTIAPVGFIQPFGKFPAALVLSPARDYLAVVDEDGTATQIVIQPANSPEVLQQFSLPGLWGGVVWTSGGFFASGGYTGHIFHLIA